MPTIKEDIQLLNTHFEGCSVFQGFRLEEDTVSFRLSAGGVTGVVNLSLMERSRYPLTGALVFADGSDALNAIVERCSASISECAALSTVVRMIGAALEAAPAGLAELLQGLPEPEQRKRRRDDGSGAAMEEASEEEDDDDDEQDEGEDVDDDEEECNMDYDFEKGAELENKLLRLRHEWEMKDQRRRKANDPDDEDGCAGEAQAAAAAVVVQQQQQQPRRKGQAEAKRTQKRGAHQIFSAAEATRMLCNELFDLMKEHAEGFYGVQADCVDYDIHAWRVQIRCVRPAAVLLTSPDIRASLRAVISTRNRPCTPICRSYSPPSSTRPCTDCANGRLLPTHPECSSRYCPFPRLAPPARQELKRRHGYDSLELELNFVPDMYPFYPVYVKVRLPALISSLWPACASASLHLIPITREVVHTRSVSPPPQVLRPRFIGVAAEAMMSHPVMTLQARCSLAPARDEPPARPPV